MIDSSIVIGSAGLAGSVTLKVMLGTALLGATAGVIGTYAVLRRRALVGDMLAHAALPGVCVAFLLKGVCETTLFPALMSVFPKSVLLKHMATCLESIPKLVWLSGGAFASGMLGLLALAVIRRWTRTKDDAAIGIILSTFFGAGVVLLSFIQRHVGGNQAGLDTYLFGEIAGMQLRDIRLLAIVAGAILLAVILLHKEFKLLSFDPDFTATQGWPTFALDMAMMGLLAVVTIVGLPICGVILMASLIILPSAAARYWTNRLGTLLIMAGIIGAIAGAAGTLFASPLLAKLPFLDSLATNTTGKNLPPGPLIVLTATTLLIFSLLFAPRHGAIARSFAEFRLRARIVREHLLRSLYELSEPHLPERPTVALNQLVDYRSWSRWHVDWQVRRAQRRGLVEFRNDAIQLTEPGLAVAAELTRTHRLWELFLVEHANIAADHVDRDADDVEHMLPTTLIHELEQQLANKGQLPATGETVPQSPHEL